MCRECCPGGFSCPGGDQDLRIICCPSDCDIIPHPDDPDMLFADVELTLSAGGSLMTFERKERVDRSTGQRHYEITFEQRFRTLGRRARLTVQAVLAGPDAGVGSLLYTVAYLTLGPGALDALRADGYDVSLVGAPPALQCPSAFSGTCAALANQLSEGIAASLTFGSDGERAPFLAGLLRLRD
jgi:hypothetical protein